jgi:hypothetical protein
LWARPGTLMAIALLVVGCGSSSPSASPPASLATAGPATTPVASGSASPAPTSLPSGSPTVAPSATPFGSSLAWHAIGTLDAERIVGFTGGYVATNGSQAVSYSADGSSWERIRLPFKVTTDPHGIKLTAQADAVATDGTQVIVVGGYEHAPCTPQASGETGGGPQCPSSPIAWISSDGRTWTSSYPWNGPALPHRYKQGDAFTTVWAVPTGGWDAADAYISGEAGAAADIWHSADGLSWSAFSATPPTTLEGSPTPPELWDVGAADSTGRRVISGQWYGPSLTATRLATTQDGESWTTIDTFPGADVSVFAMLPPTSASSAWIVAGSDGSERATAWTSPGLATWTALSLPTPQATIQGRVTALGATSRGLIALGWTSTDPDAAPTQATWVSADGHAWSELTPAPDSGGPDVLADGPAGVIGVSLGYHDTDPSVVWALQ